MTDKTESYGINGEVEQHDNALLLFHTRGTHSPRCTSLRQEKGTSRPKCSSLSTGAKGDSLSEKLPAYLAGRADVEADE